MNDGALLEPTPEDRSEFSPALRDLIAQVVDGGSIDWGHARGSVRGSSEAGLLDVLEGLHRLAAHAEQTPEPGGSLRPAPQPSLTVADSPVPFARWGPLTLRCRIGTGAFGEVFLAHDDTLGRDVALKLFSPHAALSAGGAMALVREARRLARVRQDNIVDVYGADIHEGRAGFWMEYVRGETLEQRLAAGGKFHAWEATWVGLQLCRALSAIHTAGLLHLDVKASNVLREDGGRIVLTDFGAVVEADSRGRAVARTHMTTPLSAAPELLRGEAPTAAADIYALGALLYRLVAGAHPVEGGSVDELRERHERAPRSSLRDARVGLCPAFVAVVERALEPDPSRRFGSAAEMEGALRSAAALELALPPEAKRAPSESVMPGDVHSGVAARRPGWRWTLAGGLLAVAITVAIVLRTWTPPGLSSRTSYFHEDFAAPDKDELLRHRWQLLYPDQEHWRLPHAQGRLTLHTLRGDLWTKDQEQPFVPNLLARPFTSDRFRVTALLTDFHPRHNWQQAGLVLLDHADQYVRLTVGYDGGSGQEGAARVTVGAVFEEEGTVIAQPMATLKPFDDQPLQKVWLQIVKDGESIVLRYREGAEYGAFRELARRDFKLRQRYVALAAFQGITQELPGGARQPLTWDPVPAHFDFVSVEPLQ